MWREQFLKELLKTTVNQKARNENHFVIITVSFEFKFNRQSQLTFCFFIRSFGFGKNILEFFNDQKFKFWPHRA